MSQNNRGTCPYPCTDKACGIFIMHHQGNPTQYSTYMTNCKSTQDHRDLWQSDLVPKNKLWTLLGLEPRPSYCKVCVLTTRLGQATNLNFFSFKHHNICTLVTTAFHFINNNNNALSVFHFQEYWKTRWFCIWLYFIHRRHYSRTTMPSKGHNWQKTQHNHDFWIFNN